MYKFKLKEIESGEVEVYGYQTQHFDVCPGAQSLYKRIVDEDLVDNKDLVERSAKLHDALFALEKNALERGSNELDIETAQLLADQIMAMAEMMDLESEHQYIQGHVDKIKGATINEIEVGDTDTKGGKKSTVTSINPETGAIEWDVADVADFSSTYNALKKAKDFIDVLDKSAERTKTDPKIDKFAIDIARLFNDFRSHVRKVYPEEYKRVLRLKESVNEGHGLDQGDLDYLQHIADKNPDDTKLEKIIKFLTKSNILVDKTKDLSKGKEVEEGEGIGYLTPRAFDKNKKSKGAPSIYYYKLGYKPVPKIKPKSYDIKKLFEYSDFQQKRISVFDEIEEKVNSISPLLSSAKNETAEYYNENPGSYAIVYSTDMANELLDDIIKLLKQSE